MAQSDNPLVLDYLDVSGQLAAQAVKLAAAVEAEAAEARPFVASGADALVAVGLVQPHEKQAALDMLGSHSGALQVVSNLTNLFKQEQAKTAAAHKQAAVAGLGAPAGSPAPSRAKTANAVAAGGRRGLYDEPSEADRMFADRMLGRQ